MNITTHAALFLTLGLALGSAQFSPSPLAGFTPPAVAPGAPNGSFGLSEIDTINPANRNLNVSLNLYTVKGRGSVSLPITLNLGVLWNIRSRPNCIQTTPGVGCTGWGFSFFPTANWWQEGSSQYTRYLPALVKLRKSGDDSFTWFNALTGYTFPAVNLWTNSQFTAILPDRTEIELRDAATSGMPDPTGDNPLASPGVPQGINRGTKFVSVDGSAASFLSDASVSDYVPVATASVFDADGWLFLKDGTRMRIDQGRPVRIADRNGNLTTATYDTGRITSITNSNGHTTTFSYQASAQSDGCTGAYDLITYPGTGGTTHTVRVNFRLLSALANAPSLLPSMLRDGFTVQTYAQLFPSAPGGVTVPNQWSPGTGPFDPCLVSDIVLPNNQKYIVQYNPHGFVAKIQLPSGGKIEYDYQTVIEAGAPGASGTFSNFLVKPKVSAKRIYKSFSDAPPESTIEFADGPSNAYTDVKHTHSNGSVLAWTRHYYLKRTNGAVQTTVYPAWDESKEFKVEELKADGTVLRRIEKVWEQRPLDANYNGEVFDGPTTNLAQSRLHDPRVITEKITWVADGNLTSQKDFTYDRYNNVTSVKEFDFGTNAPGSLIQRRQTDFFNDYADFTTSPATTSHIRSLPASESLYDADTGGNLLSQTLFYYDGRTESSNSTVGPLSYGSTVGRHNEAASPNYTTVGNLTRVRNLRSAGNYVAVSATYDVNGGMTSLTDALGQTTAFSYVENHNDSPLACGIGGNNTSYAHVVLVTRPIARPGRTAMKERYCWDYYLGALKGQQDANGQLSTYEYESGSMGLDRLKIKNAPDAGQFLFDYCDDASANCSVGLASFSGLGVVTRQRLDASRWITAFSRYDGLGREFETRQLAPSGSGNNDVAVSKEFDGLGRAIRQSLPYFVGDTPVNSQSTFDTIGRTLEVRNLGDNSFVRITPGASETLTEDESRTAGSIAGTKKRIVRNALGWITRVVENEGGTPTNTHYRYDAAGRLLGVCQGAPFSGGTCNSVNARGRAFTYNNLGWLLTATNPESGTITYDHDANGKVISRTSADNSIVTMNYDALGRIIRKTFTGPRTSSPQTFCYDGDAYSGSDCVVGTVLNGLGRMTEARNDISSTRYLSFDAVGRIKQSQQTTGTSGPHLFAYSYNLAGMREQMTMPSTRVVNTTYDAMGRVSGANWGTAPRSISGIQYWANGAQKQASLGNGLTEAWTFSPTRWQARQVSVTSATATLLNLQFDYCGTGPLVECASNNGNVIRQLSTAGLSWDHIYSYDGWNRLTGYTEGGSAMEGYGFDEFGNRWLTSRSTALPGLIGLATTSNWFNAKNRLLDPIQAPNESTFYDAAGNQIRIGAMNLTYDGEGRVAGATNTGSGVVTYDYDAADKRVRSTVSGVSTVYVYEASGELAAEYGVSSGTSGPEFLTGDHLGSVRLVTDGAGAVKQRRDYGPFGEELETASRTAILGYGTGGQRHRFTGKERDLETGLDYFGARYMSAAQGRFTSPDAVNHPSVSKNPIAFLSNPQRWNGYGYVSNNPLRLVDPDGREEEESWLDLASRYLGMLFQPARLESATNPSASNGPTSGPWLDRETVVKSHEELGKGLDVVLELHLAAFDRTGVVSAANSMMKGDSPGASLAMLGAVIPGGQSGGRTTLVEAKRLVGLWAPDPVKGTIKASLIYHFNTHGAGVGADSMLQYLRKAEGFLQRAQKSRKTRTVVLDEGKRRLELDGRYVIVNLENKIVSFGNQR